MIIDTVEFEHININLTYGRFIPLYAFRGERIEPGIKIIFFQLEDLRES